MNRFKKLSILLGVLAIACIATFAVTQMEEQKEQIKNSGEIILALSSESVQSLSWEYNGESLSFHKDEVWLYDKDENFPVSAEKITELLEQFQAFGAAFIIENVEDYGQYGLDHPICTIKLSTAEQIYEVKLGDYSKMDSQRYISIGDGNVYLAKHDPLDKFNVVLSDMIEQDEIPSFAHVSEIQFAGTETYSITYQENSSDTYSADDIYFTRQNGENLPLDTSKVDAYLRNITNLNLTNYVSYHVTDEELQAYGLDAPELTITVNYTTEGADREETSNSFVLYVSPDPEERKGAEEAEKSDEDAETSAYIRIGESQIVYKVSSSSYKKLTTASYNDFRHAEVIWVDFSHVQQIDISLEGNQYIFTSQRDKDAHTWYYQEKEFEITAFQTGLENLSATEFVHESPIQKEEISLVVSLDNENFPQIQIKLYRYDGSHCLAVVDGKSVSLVDRTAVVHLIEAVYAVVLD